MRLEVVGHKRRAKRVNVNPKEATVVQVFFILHDQGRAVGAAAGQKKS